jgi:hypothetical protein
MSRLSYGVVFDSNSLSIMKCPEFDLLRNLVYAFVVLVLFGWGVNASTRKASSPGQTITVPLDYKAPTLGSRAHRVAALDKTVN